MFSLVVLLCCLEVLVASAPQKVLYSIEDAPKHFEDFVKTYNKEYKSQIEKQIRFEIFKNNLKDINEKNKKDESAVFGINQFTDLTKEEFRRTYTGFLPLGSETDCTQSSYNGTRVAAPDSFDWRQQNKVSSVKDQGKCGSCWAFSTVGTVEGQYAIKHNQIVDLSPQQVVDCTKKSDGCQGGSMPSAILELAQFGGLMSDQDYPYRMSKGTCTADANRIAARVQGCRQFILSGEDELKETLVQVGPLSISVAASTWGSYSGGILASCDTLLDHAVLLVGYGSENGVPYWIIKNSWGTAWGESGYIRLRRNQNTCNLMSGVFVTAVVE